MSSRLSIDEHVKIIELFTSCQSIVVTQRKFRTFTTKMNAPIRKSVERIVTKLKENGSVTHQQLGASGLPRSVCNPSNYVKIEASVEEGPRLNIRKRAQSLGMKKHPSIELLEKTLNLKPFKDQKAPKINEQDKS